MLNRSRSMAYLLVGWGLSVQLYILWNAVRVTEATGEFARLSSSHWSGAFTATMAGLALLVLIGELDQRLKEQRGDPQESVSGHRS